MQAAEPSTCVDTQQGLALRAGAGRPQHRIELVGLQVQRGAGVAEGGVQQRLQLRHHECCLRCTLMESWFKTQEDAS